jgi:hypothetical protein
VSLSTRASITKARASTIASSAITTSAIHSSRLTNASILADEQNKQLIAQVKAAENNAAREARARSRHTLDNQIFMNVFDLTARG